MAVLNWQYLIISRYQERPISHHHSVLLLVVTSGCCAEFNAVLPASIARGQGQIEGGREGDGEKEKKKKMGLDFKSAISSFGDNYMQYCDRKKEK